MKSFGDKPPVRSIEEEEALKVLKEGWNKEVGWIYKEGERAELPLVFENFYKEFAVYLEGKKALDIGCGEGRFLIPMLQDGLNVIGMDIADERIKKAQANLERARNTLKGKVDLLVGDSKKLNFPNESFSYVFAKGSIHHNTWEGVQQSFKEAVRVLKPGGFFLFQGRSIKDSVLTRAEPIPDVGHTAIDKDGWKAGMIQHYFTKEELEQLAVENGLEIIVGPEERVKDDGNARWWVVYQKGLGPLSSQPR